MGGCLMFGPWLAALAGGVAQGPPRCEPVFTDERAVYNYAPCLVQDEDPGTRWVFYCANREPGTVTDHICSRRGALVEGKWHWGEEGVALSPGRRGFDWDSRHVCDPEVVAGRFALGGVTYRLALFYLGTDAENSTHNQVGLALANSLAGPWAKYPRPLMTYTPDQREDPVAWREGWPIYRHWGVGQPSATSVDGKGRVLLFYSRGDTEHGEEWTELDLSDLDAGSPPVQRRKLPTAGLVGTGGGRFRSVWNASIVYDPPRDRFIMVREGDLPPTDGYVPQFVSAEVQIAEIAGSGLWSGEGIWRVVAEIGPARTGWPRNHNPGLLRTLHGALPDPERLTVAFSVAEAYATPPAGFEWLWTYRICTTDLRASAGP
jgi:hypothetical protein